MHIASKDMKICSTSHIIAAAAAAKSLQSCLTLCDPIDSSPPRSPIPGILQARKLEWVAISFSKHMSLGNCKLKEWDSPTFLLEWTVSKTVIKQFTAGRNAKWNASLEDSLVVSFKIEHTLPIWPSNNTP